MSAQLLTHAPAPSLLFPPALARLVRDRLAPKCGCLADVTDDELVQLLTTIFFAGLETYEGVHHPIGVTFVGRSTTDFVMAEPAAAGALPLYRWKILRFASPRPFENRELVKLAVAGADRRIYCAVGVVGEGQLAITGLAREGIDAGPDPFVTIVAPRPGCLSIRTGRARVIEYERGIVLAVGEDAVFADGPVHDALAAIARAGGVDDDVVPHYVDAVRVLVREIVAHGHGGLLVVSAEENPPVAESTYRMLLDSSLSALLRLAWRIDTKKGGAPPARPRRSSSQAFGQLLRNAFLTEAERVIEELGRLTAIDGAVLLNRDLALIAFGVILPVRQQIDVFDATETENARLVDFGSRGTRHRAAATYAAEHPGSVVFVASEDGQVSCMLRDSLAAPVRLWRLVAGTAPIAQ